MVIPVSDGSRDFLKSPTQSFNYFQSTIEYRNLILSSLFTASPKIWISEIWFNNANELLPRPDTFRVQLPNIPFITRNLRLKNCNPSIEFSQLKKLLRSSQNRFQSITGYPRCCIMLRLFSNYFDCVAERVSIASCWRSFHAYPRGNLRAEKSCNHGAKSLLTYSLCCQSFTGVWSRTASRKSRRRLSPRIESCAECEWHLRLIQFAPLFFYHTLVYRQAFLAPTCVTHVLTQCFFRFIPGHSSTVTSATIKSKKWRLMLFTGWNPSNRCTYERSQLRIIWECHFGWDRAFSCYRVLYGNKITELPSGVFHGLTNLQLLWVQTEIFHSFD